MLQLLFCVTYFRYWLTAEQTISVNIIVVVAAIAAAVVVQEGFRVGRKAKNKILFNSNNVDNIVAYRVDRHVGGVENLESVMSIEKTRDDSDVANRPTKQKSAAKVYQHDAN